MAPDSVGQHSPIVHSEKKKRKKEICEMAAEIVQSDSDSLRAGRSGSRISMGERFSASVQTGHGAHPPSNTMDTESFPGLKRPGRSADHPSPSSAEVVKRLNLYLHLPSVPAEVNGGMAFIILENMEYGRRHTQSC